MNDEPPSCVDAIDPWGGTDPASRSPWRAFRDRYLDVSASIYVYNEHRGYTSIDRAPEAVRARCPDDAVFIAAIEQHRAGERSHCVTFCRWFDLRRRMPLSVDRACGHIDRFVEMRRGGGGRFDYCRPIERRVEAPPVYRQATSSTNSGPKLTEPTR